MRGSANPVVIRKLTDMLIRLEIAGGIGSNAIRELLVNFIADNDLGDELEVHIMKAGWDILNRKVP